MIRHGLQALKKTDLNTAYRSIKQGRETKRENHRREFSTFYMKYVLYPEWSSESAVVDRVKFLKTEIEKNPSYVDLYSELGRCYLEQAKMAWQNGMDQYRRALEMNPSMTDVSDSLAVADKAFAGLKAALKEIVAKG